MTLFQIIQRLKDYALHQHNVMYADEGSVYTILNNNPSNRYASFIITQNSHREQYDADIYNFTLFYVDRLVDDLETNRVSVQSIGKEVLGNIIRMFCEDFDLDFPTDINYTVFTERFVDLCAGCYANVSLTVYKGVCDDEDSPVYRPIIKIQSDKKVRYTENGEFVVVPDNDYSAMSSVLVEVDVPEKIVEPKLQEKKITDNGKYFPDNGFDGFASVEVEIDCPDCPEREIRLKDINIDRNGTYNVETGYDGFGTVVVDVSCPESECRLQEKGIRITNNGKVEVLPENGFDGLSKVEIDVDVPETIVEPKLQEKNITNNGEYTPDEGFDGFSKVNVDIECSGDCRLQEKTILKSGEYTPDAGYDGFSKVICEPILDMTQIAVKENGTYFPEKPYDGFYKVTVDVKGNLPTLFFEDYFGYGTPQLFDVTPEKFERVPRSWRQYAFYKTYLNRLEIPLISHYTNHFVTGDTFEIPAYFAAKSVIQEIIIPEGYTHINEHAFADLIPWEPSNFSTNIVELPESLQVIGSYAFRGIRKPEKIVLGENLKRVGTNAFDDASVKEFEINSNGIELGVESFRALDCDSLVFGENVKEVNVKAQAFHYCKVKDFQANNVLFYLTGYNDGDTYRTPYGVFNESKGIKNVNVYGCLYNTFWKSEVETVSIYGVENTYEKNDGIKYGYISPFDYCNNLTDVYYHTTDLPVVDYVSQFEPKNVNFHYIKGHDEVKDFFLALYPTWNFVDDIENN